MPYVSVPLLAACLRRAGHEALPIDANAEAIDALLRPDALAELARRVGDGFRALDRQPALSHAEQLRYVTLHDALADAATVPGAIAAATAVLRDATGVRFFDAAAYDAAVAVVQGALRLASAAHAPLQFDLVAWRTPFALLDAAELRRDAAPDRDPFHRWAREVLVPRLRSAGVRLVGLSVAFPAQVQPAWSLAWAVREALPEVTLVVGGPAVTQRLLVLSTAEAEALLPPFDAAVLFEGEAAIVDLAEAVARGERPRGLIRGRPPERLADLPPPDFVGLPFPAYLSPAPVLPYDDTRGCYFGRCAFCHYGLAETGTACYRERPVERVAADLVDLSERHGARIFYLSHDTLAPRTAERLADAIRATGAPLRWAGDIRPERTLGAERCRRLAAGGALALSVGVESGAPRVLELIDKGVAVDDVRTAIRHLAGAGIAVEAMAFTDFPTETRAEALATVRFLADHRDAISLFVCGAFDLTAGSRVALDPARYGVREVRRLGGGLGVAFAWEAARPPKGAADRAAVDAALARLERHWTLRPYPWAGSLSTAHTLLWLDHFGPAAFRRADRPARAAQPLAPSPAPASRLPRPRFDIARLADAVWAREAAIWHTLVHEQRHVSRAAYDALARTAPAATPSGARPRRRSGPGRKGSGRA